MQQCKVKIRKKTQGEATNGAPAEAPERTKKSTTRGAEKHLWETACPRQSWPISGVLAAVWALQKKHIIRDHKRSTRETRGFAKTGHQQVQSESTNEAPESTIRDHKGAPERPAVLPKRSTSKSNQRAQMKHQKIQSETTKGAPERPVTRGFCQNGAPASPIREHK